MTKYLFNQIIVRIEINELYQEQQPGVWQMLIPYLFLSSLCRISSSGNSLPLGTPCPGKSLDLLWLVWNKACALWSARVCEQLPSRECDAWGLWPLHKLVCVRVPSAQLLSLSQPCRTFTSLNFHAFLIWWVCKGLGEVQRHHVF